MLNKIKKIGIFIVIAIIIIVAGALIWYFTSISPVNKKNIEEVKVEIPLGTGTSDLAKILKENDIIKNEKIFELYIKLNKESGFQAGTYYLKQSMNLKEIIEMLKTGIMYDPNQITITFIEGKKFEWLAKTIEEKTDNTKEEIYELLENEEYINSLIEKYWFLTDEIKQEEIYYSLEGYLFPDTYAFDGKDVTVEEIFEKMLDQMGKVLEEDKEAIEESKYSVHKLLTIASIIEKESMTDEGRKDVSSVIYNRLEKGMAIQSDVTTYYAIKVDMGERDLYKSELNRYNAYNTRGPNMEGKLPIGPISAVGRASIEAAIYPSGKDYLYFVADKNGDLYFSNTINEHDSKVSELKSEGLWYEY